VLMQTSLLIDPLTISKQLIQKYGLGDDFLPQSLFLRALYDGQLFDALYFATLLAASRQDGDEKHPYERPHKSYANFLLSSIGWPSVEELLRCFEEDIEENIDLATNKSRAAATLIRMDKAGVQVPNILSQSRETSGLLPLAKRKKRQLETFRALCLKLWEDDRNIVEPAYLFPEAPQPILADLREGGIATWCADEQQDFWDVELETQASVFFHICQKIMFSRDLACYSDPFGETAKFDCPFLEECIAVPRKSKLGFCKRDEWRSLVNQMLSDYGLELK